MNIHRRLPRWTNRLYARVAGYFWVPCPICGRDFGGHEIGDGAFPPTPQTLVVSGDDWELRISDNAEPTRCHCWRCDDYVRLENDRAELAVLGPERYAEVLGWRSASALKMIGVESDHRS